MSNSSDFYLIQNIWSIELTNSNNSSVILIDKSTKAMMRIA